MLPEEFQHKETVYVAREDGCACRYVPFTGNMDFFRLTLTPGTDVP
jgi:hypothetical protein